MDIEQPAVQKDDKGIDLVAVSKLVHEIERDIEQLQNGSGDVDVLRAEVRTLGLALKTPDPQDPRISHGLKMIRGIVANIEDDVFIVADYGRRIGRMLGM